MKELSIEEKARSYDEKLDVARHIYADPSVKDEDKYYIEVIFPELKESEDEKIRKEIISLVQYTKGRRIGYEPRISQDDMIAWLEKQGEHIHLWTINDARCGDVLFYKGTLKYSNGIKYERICLFNNLDNAFFTLTKTSNHVEEYDIDVNIDYPANTIPATKGQKEILFMVMKEAGYEWDAEKKELKKIEQKKNTHNKLTDFESSLKHIMEEAIECGDTHNLKADADMLLSLVQNSAWSEEDERNCEWLMTVCDRIHYKSDPQVAPDSALMLKEWLKSLKDRVQPQPKQEWSEKDENHVKSILSTIECCKAQFPNAQAVAEAYNADIEWLNSLRHQNTWKPNDEQMAQLHKYCPDNRPLTSLYEQLKKLREE